MVGSSVVGGQHLDVVDRDQPIMSMGMCETTPKMESDLIPHTQISYPFQPRSTHSVVVWELRPKCVCMVCVCAQREVSYVVPQQHTSSSPALKASSSPLRGAKS